MSTGFVICGLSEFWSALIICHLLIKHSEASEEAARAVSRHNGLPLLLGALQYFKEWDAAAEGEDGDAMVAAEGAEKAGDGSDGEEEEESGDDEEEEGGEKKGKKKKKKQQPEAAGGAAAVAEMGPARVREEALVAACHALRASVEAAGYPLVEQLLSRRGGGGGGGGPAPAPLSVVLALLYEEEGAAAADEGLPFLARVHLAGCVGAVYLELKRAGFTDTTVGLLAAFCSYPRPNKQT